jgi:hypothetical protein
MKRKIISLMAAILMLAGTAFGQIIYTNEDYNHNRAEGDASSFGVMVPMQDVNYDQWKYAPLSDGLWLLAGLGGAYLLKKKKSQK